MHEKFVFDTMYGKLDQYELFHDFALWGGRLNKYSPIPSNPADNHDEREYFNAGSLSKTVQNS